MKNSRLRDDTGRFQPEQAPINNRILTQMDAISKHLTAIEKSSASAARPKAKNLYLELLLVQASVTTYFVSTTYFVLPDLFCINF